MSGSLLAEAKPEPARTELRAQRVAAHRARRQDGAVAWTRGTGAGAAPTGGMAAAGGTRRGLLLLAATLVGLGGVATTRVLQNRALAEKMAEKSVAQVQERAD